METGPLVQGNFYIENTDTILMKHTLLIVDDETDNLDALERVFRKKFFVIKANSGPKALEYLKEHKKIAVIISDQRMPEMTGVEFLSESMKTHPETIRILLTGYTDLDSVIAAINSGQVYRYITKPWDTRDLQITIDQAVEKFELEGELKIKNQELEKTYKELKTLDEAKSQFMILINHELKTPLTTLVSFLELLMQTQLDEEQKKYSHRIQKSADRLNEMIFDSLELVSSELGNIEINKKKCSLEDLFQKAETQLRSRIQKDFTVQYQLEVKNENSDPTILGKIIFKILKNAVQHGDHKSPIEVKSSIEGSRTRISITNSGETISKETIDKILKPFALNENIMNHSKGLGLGLSICQSFLKHLNSQLEIKSEKKQIVVSFLI